MLRLSWQCSFLLFLAVAALACEGDLWSQRYDTSQHAIIGGEVSGPEDAAIVALRIEREDGQRGLCSGVVVAPLVVLTAAHCVAPQAVGAGAAFYVQVDGMGEELAVDRVEFDPEFDLDLIARGHDIAVAITAEPIPVTPLDVSSQPALGEVDTLRLVGYGVSSTAMDDTEGVRREGLAPLDGFDSLFLTLGEGAMPCLGDSGGAAFANLDDGSEALAGIVSFTQNACGSGTKVTNLATYQKFVEEQIDRAEADDSSPGCTAAGRGGQSTLAVFFGLVAMIRSRRRKRQTRRR